MSISTSFTSKSQTNSKVKTATIAINQSQSSIIDLDGVDGIAIQMPSAWTTAQISFLASDNYGGTYSPIYGMDNLEIVAEAAASKVISFDTHSSIFKTLRFIKLRSGTASVPVTQTAAREIKVILK